MTACASATRLKRCCAGFCTLGKLCGSRTGDLLVFCMGDVSIFLVRGGAGGVVGRCSIAWYEQLTAVVEFPECSGMVL